MKVSIGRYPKKGKQKISVKIDPWDTWSMDHTLGIIILPMLKQLKETTHGAPFVDDEDVPEELKSTSAPPKENEYDTDANHFKRWDWALDEMIFAFEHKVDDSWEEEFRSGEIDWIEALERMASKGKPFFVATGASTIGEVQKAVHAILKINKQLV